MTENVKSYIHEDVYLHIIYKSEQLESTYISNNRKLLIKYNLFTEMDINYIVFKVIVIKKLAK